MSRCWHEVVFNPCASPADVGRGLPMLRRFGRTSCKFGHLGRYRPIDPLRSSRICLNSAPSMSWTQSVIGQNFSCRAMARPVLLGVGAAHRRNARINPQREIFDRSSHGTPAVDRPDPRVGPASARISTWLWNEACAKSRYAGQRLLTSCHLRQTPPHTWPILAWIRRASPEIWQTRHVVQLSPWQPER